MTADEEPTSAEWKILKIVWDQGPLAAREVVDADARTSEWSMSTDKTLLRRLAAKGSVCRRDCPEQSGAHGI